MRAIHAFIRGSSAREGAICVEVGARPPHLGELRPHRPAPLLVVGPVDVVVRHRARHRGVEDDRLHALGRQRRGGDGQRPAGGVAHEHRALAARGVEDGEDVARLVLQRHRLAARVRQAAAAAVHVQQPAEAHEALEEAGQPRLLPQVLDVRDEAGDEEQVGRRVAGRRPRDGGLAVAGVARLDLHRALKPTDVRSPVGPCAHAPRP